MPEFSITDTPFLLTDAAFQDLVNLLSSPETILTRRGEKVSRDSLTEIRDRVAVINIQGPIYPEDSFVSWLYGGPSAGRIAEEIAAAVESNAVQSIVLNIDSPGGSATGINELSEIIYNLRGRKNMIAYVGGTAASAAYWIASAADKIVIDATAAAGSIGVVIATYPKSGSRVEIVSTVSPKKALDPATAEGKKDLLTYIDAIAEVFVASVARNRGVSVEKVLSDFGQGSVLVGAAAVEAGLADEIGSLEKTITQIRRLAMPEIKTLAELEAAYPALVKEARGEPVDTTKIKTDAENATIDRVIGLAKVQFSAEEAEAFSKIVKLGLTPEQFAAVKATMGTPKPIDVPKDPPPKTAEQLQAERLQQIINAGNVDVGAGIGGDKLENKDFMTLVRERMAEAKCSLSDAMLHVNKTNPESRQAYLKSIQSSQSGKSQGSLH